MMKGLELAKRYYEAYGKPMIAEQFPEYEGRIAVGLAGPGSECFGYGSGRICKKCSFCHISAEPPLYALLQVDASGLKRSAPS